MYHSSFLLSGAINGTEEDKVKNAMEALEMLTKVIGDTRPGGHHAVMDQLNKSMQMRKDGQAFSSKALGAPETAKEKEAARLKEKLKEMKAKRGGKKQATK